jgi:NADH dehydrogenase/NADH:ubiquinone oxidoreductase subunit G
MEIILNGVNVQVEDNWTILDAANFYGVNIPTLCHHEGLSPYGSCRLCTVEIGKGDRTKLVASCLHPVKEGLIVRTHTKRVVDARKMLVELLVARCPQSKVIQDIASAMGVDKVRFEPKNDDCILCGLCIRMCEEQMDAKAIGFVGRGVDRKITTPFDIKSDKCRTCGACIFICPACQLRCQGPDADTVLCSGCLNFSPSCLDLYEETMCYMDPCVACLENKKLEKKTEKVKKSKSRRKKK